MPEHIPAWKRLGLKVENSVTEDPLAIAAHIETADVTQKKTKELKRKRQAMKSASIDISEKKPPKRVKLPKSERAPPPEKDQLVYLKQYSQDKKNWKFSKQKQNWILKNIRHIPDSYIVYLEEYVSGMVGGSRDRLIESLTQVVKNWNEAAEKVALALENPDEKNETEKDTKENAQDKENDSAEPVDFDYAKRAKELIEKMTGEKVVLSGVEEEEEKEEEEAEEDKKKEHQDNEGKFTPSEDLKDEIAVDRSNLIIDNVEVSEYIDEDDFKDPPGASKNANQEDTNAVVTESIGLSETDTDSKKKVKKDKKKNKKKEKKDKKSNKEKKDPEA
ncbi:unnamed protein product [Kuraishia capsulata CBS 1993]|uniref:WKF domain-containing protein n=1 Tax=Kuraishia capsulata CBS 1993 TaxID=1382522 RepID=W6MKB5_9ASCO|nr:uncharacterized protein KUCA_T00002410001 [Kuraishia capsulata CBS 1993]CDK26438.1 unnamed protein product [Kuraishia capsulata CBS 1993]